MKTIVFYAYKGGTGRTLALANMATYLAQIGMRVVALDFDLEAPGLHYKLHRPSTVATGPTEESEGRLPRGVMGYMADALRDGEAPPNLGPYILDVTPQPVSGGSTEGNLTLIPAGPAPAAPYWLLSQAVRLDRMLADQPDMAVAILAELKGQIEHELRPDLLLVDGRTGIVPSNAVAVRLWADHVAVFAIPTREHLAGAAMVLDEIAAEVRPDGSKIETTLVLSRLPDEPLQFDGKTLEKPLEELLGPFPSTTLPEQVVRLRTDSALQEGEFLHLQGWARKGHSRLTDDYFDLLRMLSPEADGAHDRAIQRRVTEIKASILETGDPNEVTKQLSELAGFTNHWAALDGRVWAIRVLQTQRPEQPEHALDLLSMMTPADLARSTQIEPVLVYYLERLRPPTPSEANALQPLLNSLPPGHRLVAGFRQLLPGARPEPGT